MPAPVQGASPDASTRRSIANPTRFKNAHHLILQRRPRPKKLALILRQRSSVLPSNLKLDDHDHHDTCHSRKRSPSNNAFPLDESQSGSLSLDERRAIDTVSEKPVSVLLLSQLLGLFPAVHSDESVQAHFATSPTVDPASFDIDLSKARQQITRPSKPKLAFTCHASQTIPKPSLQSTLESTNNSKGTIRDCGKPLTADYSMNPSMPKHHPFMRNQCPSIPRIVKNPSSTLPRGYVCDSVTGISCAFRTKNISAEAKSLKLQLERSSAQNAENKASVNTAEHDGYFKADKADTFRKESQANTQSTLARSTFTQLAHFPSREVKGITEATSLVQTEAPLCSKISKGTVQKHAALLPPLVVKLPAPSQNSAKLAVLKPIPMSLPILQKASSVHPHTAPATDHLITKSQTPESLSLPNLGARLFPKRKAVSASSIHNPLPPPLPSALGFNRNTPTFLAVRKRCDRMREYAEDVRRRTLGSSRMQEVVACSTDSRVIRDGSAKQKRDKMLAYAATVKKPTLARSAGISIVPAEKPLPNNRDLRKDSGMDLQILTDLHVENMKVVESIKREMGFC